MKNLISTFIFSLLVLSSVLATSTPTMNIINNDEITVTELAIFNSASFDAETEHLLFNTADDISVIQIFDTEGNLEFQLPVMSNQVKINKNLFGEGTFNLGFLIKGDSQVHFSTVTVK